MALHRGLKLRASRRRKPGGDFGKFGLEDASGAPVFGIGAEGLGASAGEVEAYLRGAVAADWKTSVRDTPAPKRPARPPVTDEPPRRPSKPKPAASRAANDEEPLPKAARKGGQARAKGGDPAPPPPPPPPRFAPEVGNLFADLPDARRAEAFTTLAEAAGSRVERIVSAGQRTPERSPMRQSHDEWVIVLAGEAAMRIEDSEEVVLGPGDHLLIRAGQRHWVTGTSKDPPTVWLAVHLGEG
ncbi:cupin domain-containing protein [Sphingomonas aracearum]|uniref:Cupin domain-containing protein n=2 Tax=Sphingomonas aracearum TaxID=2283317 RepID=A0A369W022_9SPHN|nr:cupin domain-containing protein [Sphingomonas aracearum]